MALGASALEVQRHVMSQTLALVGTGIAIGLVGAFALAQLASSLLFQLKPTDPPTFLIAAAVLALAAAAAGYLPAWRASRLDPTVALRTE